MGKYILFVVVWLVNIVNPQIRCAQKSKSLYACMRVRVYACFIVVRGSRLYSISKNNNATITNKPKIKHLLLNLFVENLKQI